MELTAGNAICTINGNNAEILFNDYKKPLRVYAVGNTVFYAGLLEPVGENIGRLSFVLPSATDYILISDGRIEENYNEVLRFNFNSKYSVKKEIPTKFNSAFEEILFSQKELKDCVKLYGHYVAFRRGGSVIYAFPSDPFTHPLLQFLPYAYWYDVSICNKFRGYYFIGYENHHPQFVSKCVVDMLTMNN